MALNCCSIASSLDGGEVSGGTSWGLAAFASGGGAGVRPILLTPRECRPGVHSSCGPSTAGREFGSRVHVPYNSLERGIEQVEGDRVHLGLALPGDKKGEQLDRLFVGHDAACSQVNHGLEEHPQPVTTPPLQSLIGMDGGLQELADGIHDLACIHLRILAALAHGIPRQSPSTGPSVFIHEFLPPRRRVPSDHARPGRNDAPRDLGLPGPPRHYTGSSPAELPGHRRFGIRRGAG